MSPICIPLIFLSTLMKLASTLAKILYNGMESRHPWQTNIRVKGSDRRPFILIFDLMLVYATLIMWMNLPPYPNLCKTEKIFIQFIWLINYDTNSRKSVNSKFILFIIASDWRSPIIVFTLFFFHNNQLNWILDLLFLKLEYNVLNLFLFSQDIFKIFHNRKVDFLMYS